MPSRSLPRKVTLGLIQMRCERNPTRNLERTIDRIRAAADKGARIICLQELFNCRYFCQTEDHGNFALAEPVPGPAIRALARVARQKRIVLVAPLFEHRAKGLYHNTAAVIDADGRCLGKYRKMHIPDDPLYYEKFYFTPGDLGFRAWGTRHGRIGVLICWDQWYPEAARLTALQGAEILFYPTAIGWHPKEKSSVGRAQHDAWETAQRAHAISNGCYVAAVNRVGVERLAGDGIEFWGQSFVADPFGRILVRASADREENLIVPIDLAEVESVRTQWPFLRDRRIDAYGGMVQRFGDA